MLKLFTRLSKTVYVWMFFILLANSACQSTQATSISTQSSPAKIPMIEPTLTESVILPLPTFAESTATPQPTATEFVSLLTPNGPWLVYLRNYPHPGMADLPDVTAEFAMLNQDGSGWTPFKSPECRNGEVDDFLGDGSDSTNYMAWFADGLYLFRPSQATAMLVYQELWFSVCHTFFRGDEKGGMLISIHQPSYEVAPELSIYELPTGKIRAQIPLFKCSETNGQCNTFDISWWEFQWSPNGRYFAFPAVWEGTSTDLYVYDTEDNSIRQLTSGPDYVGQLWWSPDESWIIMGEIHDNYYPYTSSVWAVSVSNSDIKLLYSLESAYPQGLLGWLNNKRFITYDGTSLANALDLPAYNLRVVDLDSREVTSLFNGSFMSATYDGTHETIVFYAYDQEPREGYEGPGIYMVSTSDPVLYFMKDVQSMPWFSDDAGLFITDIPCENDPKGYKGFNYKREWQCFHYPKPSTISISPSISPNGQWQISIQEGTWLKTSGQQPIQISKEEATQIIWRLDSQGLFFIVNQILYYTSLPELDIKIVDKYPGGDSIIYQWVGGK